MTLPDPLIRLIEELQRLPGIGPKSAQRLAFHLLKTPREHTDRLVEAVRDVKERVTFFFFNDTATTEIYTTRHTLSLHDAHVICVPEGCEDLPADPERRPAVVILLDGL